jgi:hypothetical protein
MSEKWELFRSDVPHSWDGDLRGQSIEVEEGTAWISQEGDFNDIVLQRGESFQVSRAGRIVAESLTFSTRLRLEAI